jgi:bile acid:Na+ symporter, BASS family
VNASGVLLAALLVAAMLAVGTTVEVAGLRRVLRQPAAVAVALTANAVVVPGSAVAMLAVLDVSGPAAVGVLLAAAAPGGGSGALLADHARADTALAVSVQVLLAVAGLVILPVWLAVGQAPLNLGIAALPTSGAVLLVVGGVVGQTAPLVLGMWLRATRPAVAARVHGVARRTADALLAGIVLVSLAANIHRLGDVPTAVYGVIAVVVAVGLAAGTSPGLGGAAGRGAVAMTTTVRNLSLALFVATFTPESGHVILTVLAYGLVMYVAAVAAIPVLRRGAAPTAACS